MRKNFVILVFFLAAVLAIFNVSKVNSKASNPPAGNSGDPVATGNCTGSGCHAGPTMPASLNTLGLLIGTGVLPTDTINLPSPSFEYAGGQQYNLTFKINAFTSKYGFQIAALDASNAQAGAFTVSNPATQKINNGAGRQYMGHLNSTSTKSWTFKWTAPATTTGPITFYYCYNTADGDNNPTGDVIFQGSSTINPLLTGIHDISSKLSGLNVYPNPINGEFGLSFNLKEGNQASAQLFSIDGKQSKELFADRISAGSFNKTFDVNDMPAGIYLMKLTVDGVSVTKKVVKQ